MSKLKLYIISISSSLISVEKKADYPVEVREAEVIGPGLAFKQAFGEEAEIVATIICGDSYFNENLDKAKAEILEVVKNTIRMCSWQVLHLMPDVTALPAVRSVMLYRKSLEFRQ